MFPQSFVGRYRNDEVDMTSCVLPPDIFCCNQIVVFFGSINMFIYIQQLIPIYVYIQQRIPTLSETSRWENLSQRSDHDLYPAV